MQKGTLTTFISAIALLATPFLASAFSFSPERIFIEVAPGAQKNITVQLHNETSRAALVHVEIKSFIPSGTSGVPAFSNTALSTGIEPFVILGATDFSMKADERKEYRATVKIPTNAKPGSYYGAIHFSFSADDGGVGTLATTGPLVFLTVPGAIEAKIVIADFSTPSGWTHCLPSLFHLSVRNEGDGFAMPVGNIFVRNMFGNTIRDFSVNSDGSVLLPREERRFSIGVPSNGDSSLMNELANFGFGPYTMEARMRSVHGSDVTLRGMRFWVFPWRTISLVALISLAIAVLLGFMFPRRKNV